MGKISELRQICESGNPALSLVYVKFPLQRVGEIYKQKIFHGFIAIDREKFNTLSKILEERELSAADLRSNDKVRWLSEEETYENNVADVKKYFEGHYLTNIAMKQAYPNEHELFINTMNILSKTK